MTLLAINVIRCKNYSMLIEERKVKALREIEKSVVDWKEFLDKNARELAEPKPELPRMPSNWQIWRRAERAEIEAKLQQRDDERITQEKQLARTQGRYDMELAKLAECKTSFEAEIDRVQNQMEQLKKDWQEREECHKEITRLSLLQDEIAKQLTPLREELQRHSNGGRIVELDIRELEEEERAWKEENGQ